MAVAAAVEPGAGLAHPQAQPGVTALSGQVLAVDGLPLSGVEVSIDGTAAKGQTDSTGRFLLTGVPSGHQIMVIEGDHVAGGKRYGDYEAGVQLTAHRTTMLDYTIWLTPLDPAGDQAIPSPTRHETRIKTSQIPGLEVRIPAGTVITDAHGAAVRKLNITAIPVDRPPSRCHHSSQVPLYFTVQPGRAYHEQARADHLSRTGATSRPAQRVPFWNYEQTAAAGTSTAPEPSAPNGKQVIPDPSTPGLGVHGRDDLRNTKTTREKGQAKAPGRRRPS